MKAMTRREFLTRTASTVPIAAAVSAARPRRARAQTMTKVRFTLNWVPEGSNLFAWVARNQGFWKKRGLDVDIARGYGSMAAGQALAAGQFDLGMCVNPVINLLVAKGLPLVAIGELAYKDTMGVGVLVDSPIKTPKDLEGKTVGWTPTSGEVPFFPLFAQKTGIDEKKIKFVNMDIDVRYRALMERQIDAMTDFAVSAVPPLVSQGHPVRFMLYRDHGVRMYGSALAATRTVIKEKPDLVQAFVDGAMEGLAHCFLNPDESVEIFLKEVKESGLSTKSREYIQLGLGLMSYTALSDESEQHGLGWADPKQVGEMNDLVMTYTAAPGTRKPAPDELFTNQFAGKITLTAAQWAEAKKRSAEYAKYFGG
jgi:ABC-type nitrate/sulfonate/bicarbonate transport system substrate-binding protein